MKAVLTGAALAALSTTTTLVGCDPARGLLMSERRSGPTSAPIHPPAVQTMRAPSDRITVSSGSQSVSISAEWLHEIASQ
jgi:hypothetical protein